MEILFEKKTQTRCRESLRTVKRLQESVESVVPDTEEDIGKIVTVQSCVLLRSKDLSGHGVLVTGEARASVLCITEGRDRVFCLRVEKPFTVEFELPELTGEEQTQISLHVTASDARLMNPRKLSVTFELTAELSCYVQESVPVETRLPETACRGLHVRYVQEELLLPDAVCEKSFVLSEQFPFSGGRAQPEKLLSEQAELQIDDCQLIGSKVVVKGRGEFKIACLCREQTEPVQAAFSAPFSQILDIGAESMELCVVTPQLTGAYFDLVDSISGEKAVDAEVHVLLQLVSRSRVAVSTAADAYSNLTELQPQVKTLSFESIGAKRTLRFQEAENLELTDDCADVLCVFPALSRCALEDGKLRSAIHLDVLYRTESGELAAVRRTMMLEQDCGGTWERLLSARLGESELRPSGKSLEAHFTVEATLLEGEKTEIRSIEAVSLDETQSFDLSSFPSLTMVRVEGESLWELAKRYHSSVEAIEAFQTEADQMSGMLLIPKSV